MNEIRERKSFFKILNFIEDKEIIVIHGPRQVGKTSLLHYIIDYLKSRVYQNDIFYFDLENFRFLDMCNTSTEEVISYLKAKGVDFNKRIYVFVGVIYFFIDKPYNKW